MTPVAAEEQKGSLDTGCLLDRAQMPSFELPCPGPISELVALVRGSDDSGIEGGMGGARMTSSGSPISATAVLRKTAFEVADLSLAELDRREIRLAKHLAEEEGGV